MCFSAVERATDTFLDRNICVPEILGDLGKVTADSVGYLRKKKERIVGKFRESASQWDKAVDTSDPEAIEKRSADLEAFIANMTEERAKMETMTQQYVVMFSQVLDYVGQERYSVPQRAVG